MYPSATSPTSTEASLSPLPAGCQVAKGIDGKAGSGMYAVGWNGEVYKKSEGTYREWRGKRLDKKVWDHTLKAFETIGKGHVFKE